MSADLFTPQSEKNGLLIPLGWRVLTSSLFAFTYIFVLNLTFSSLPSLYVFSFFTKKKNRKLLSCTILHLLVCEKFAISHVSCAYEAERSEWINNRTIVQIKSTSQQTPLIDIVECLNPSHAAALSLCPFVSILLLRPYNRRKWPHLRTAFNKYRYLSKCLISSCRTL